MEKVYNMEIAGLKRSLKLYKVCDGLCIAALKTVVNPHGGRQQNYCCQ